MKPHLYVNSKGWPVTRHSYSGSAAFGSCERRYYLERVQGWNAKEDRAARHFGTALEHAVTFWHQHKQDTPAAVAEFVRLWAEHKDKVYTYAKTEGDWDKLSLTGQELVRLYAVKYKTFPYVVRNPLDFQIETRFELFPGTDYAGLEFTGYIDLMAKLKKNDADVIIDMKTSGKDVPEHTILDPQLRSYAWAKNVPNVAFLWFRKMGRSISKGDKATLLETYAGIEAGTDVIVMTTDDFGVWVTTERQVIEKMAEQFIGESKAVKIARQAYIEANGKHVLESALTKQRVQFDMAVIDKASAEDIGKRIKRDVVNIVTANQTETWLMNSGIRFPNEQCNMCAMRGICKNDAALRDTLVERKQLDELELDFAVETE